ncbi:uncharacterized protein PITG_05276 [Phytophthora infestans T30-4]|uniref:Uncharacterized protein n=1 Tax=Phytophthora infestans (strain T30-4) TaxID=403677 RepID=D0N3Y9_PHYIT|nr:uncharacterized protein PITG_05276 [Phytophthora infestans T30-4]EEY69093.1 hypothetical protein PITG_05276 [Phytophthora infestans T30-4]|eukprot:XP_002998947.1 hypothetical protein PITG_05276 [Phytophthora infestans T30-4]
MTRIDSSILRSGLPSPALLFTSKVVQISIELRPVVSSVLDQCFELSTILCPLPLGNLVALPILTVPASTTDLARSLDHDRDHGRDHQLHHLSKSYMVALQRYGEERYRMFQKNLGRNQFFHVGCRKAISQRLVACCAKQVIQDTTIE